MILIMGDMNVKVDKVQDPLNVKVGLGERNERGEFGQSGAQHMTINIKQLVSASL